MSDNPRRYDRYRLPEHNLTLVREPWPLRRLRGLAIYLGWWLDDCARDLRGCSGARVKED